MRGYYVVGIALLLVVAALGIKAIFFSSLAPNARLEPATKAGMDIFQMHLDYPKTRAIPVQEVKDPI